MSIFGKIGHALKDVGEIVNAGPEPPVPGPGPQPFPAPPPPPNPEPQPGPPPFPQDIPNAQQERT